MNDVAGKLSQTEGELVAEVQKSADKQQECPEEKKRAAELAERVHEVILPEAAIKPSAKTWLSLAHTPSPGMNSPANLEFPPIDTTRATKRPNQISSIEEKK